MEAPPISYLEAWRHRKWYFILVALLIAGVTAIVALRLPPVYESKATILIEEQQIPPEYVRSTVTGAADQHIQIITQQILSRSKLLEIIEKINLFPEQQGKRTSEAIIEKMRRDIKIETVSAEFKDKKKTQQQGMSIAFTISYQGNSPDKVNKVTNLLTSIFLEENLKYRGAQAQTTTKFLEAELKQLQDQISTVGGKISQYKITHEGLLPELQQFNFQQVDRLENEIKQVDNAIRAAENQKIYLEGLIGTVAGPKDKEMPSNPAQRLQALREKLMESQAKYSADHPDVQRLRREKDDLEKYLKGQGSGKPAGQQRLMQLQAELAQKQGLYTEDHPEIRRLKTEIAQATGEAQQTGLGDVDLANPAQVNLLTQIQTTTNEINSLKQQRQNVQDRLAMFRQRLEKTPKVEQEYLALQRDYQNAHAKYQEVMNKLMESRIAEGMEEHQKGERFTLIDPASFPEEPIKPKRLLIMAAGLMMGLIGGAAVLVGTESLDHSIKTPEELSWLTEAPPLGVINRIDTTEDLARKRRLVWISLGVVALSLLTGILIIHFFIMDITLLVTRAWQRLV